MRRAWAAFLVVALGLVASHASASVSFAVLLDALVEESNAVVVATPTSASSVWEDGRIVTYTKVHVDKVVSGAPAGDVWIRTMGGSVGNIGQQVEGEAVLLVGQQSMMFLSMHGASTVVTARGQGLFPLLKDASGALHLHRNLAAGALLGPRPASAARIRTLTTYPNAALPAADVLDGKTIDDAAAEVALSWKRTHA
jgi:hypothetical protein